MTPEEGGIKINSDDARRSSDGFAACGVTGLCLNLIPREYNMVSDSLAKLASYDNFEAIFYSAPSYSLRSLLLADAVT
ncbi:hypothetical protein GQ457_02G035060 [Hibiscus cannabinus]